jgi:hypothetical protein
MHFIVASVPIRRMLESKQSVIFSFIMFPKISDVGKLKISSGIVLGTFIRKVLGSNLGRDTGSPQGFRGFCQSTYANARVVPH